MKPIVFEGDALECLRQFPQTARREAGHQLDRVQHSLPPDDFKPMTTVGAGVYEIRIRDTAGAFRVMYVAKLADAVHVLHAFPKKTQQTATTEGSTPIARTLSRRPTMAKRSVHVEAKEVQCGVQARGC
jgi:phage-related protein